MKTLQTDLFRGIDELRRQPLVVAYGMGVDSTAVLVELNRRGIRPDAILFADTGNEKMETYAYLSLINSWLEKVKFPEVTVVRYVPKKFGDALPYTGLGENCLSNGTLPSLAFGFKSCSLKWKVLPQNKWTDRWQPARDCWRSGGKVRKIIGYDACPKDLKRYAHARHMEDPKYDYWYPLIEWGMDREACRQSIRSEGLPVPPKSACIFCPATRPEELRSHKPAYLRYIVIMEACAKPRLQGCMSAEQLQADFEHRMQLWNQRLECARGQERQKLLAKKPRLKKPGSGCAGLWRRATRQRPAMMTDYIRDHELLPIAEIEDLQQWAPLLIEQRLHEYRAGKAISDWRHFLDMLCPPDELID
ncbi:hypothetical protein [Olivibacter jilunii]|uniref:hypothetical protein n=1 Tax=Olivibacter jilunii TaxID=985016 RepID=UPI00102FBDD2|nr:hypothetical protein [Olivibacter jilunii]